MLLVFLITYHTHLGDTSSASAQHREGQIIEFNSITHQGYFIELSIKKTTEGFITRIIQFRIHQFIELIDVDLGIKDIFIFTDLLIQVLFTIIFVLNISKDLFDQILNGYKTSHRTILINDNDHMHTFLLHFSQQVIQLLGFRNEIGRAHKITYGRGIVILAQLFEHVLGIQYPDDIIDTFLVNRNTREAGLQGKVDSFINSRIGF